MMIMQHRGAIAARARPFRVRRGEDQCQTRLRPLCTGTAAWVLKDVYSNDGRRALRCCSCATRRGHALRESRCLSAHRLKPASHRRKVST
eukprot:545582-Rhodomonas_salina.2